MCYNVENRLRKRLSKIMGTMRDVARRAGVAVSTVSHVINETRFVRQETRARVLAAIEELGYQRNSVARSLRRKKTHTIGLVIPDNANPFFAEVARGIEDVSYAHDYSVILCNSDRDLRKELSYVNILVEKQVDGIILVSAGVSTEHIVALQERQKPVVVVDREIPDVNVDSVLTDNWGGGYEAVCYLIDFGHRRIGCISGPSELAPSAERVGGYKAALSNNGLEWEDNLIVRGDFQSASGYHAIEVLLSLPEPPTAIFACNDLMAIGAMARAIELGYRIPEDLSVIGFDDIALASFANPRLTTVVQPKYQMGTLAAEILLQRIGNRSFATRREVLSTELVVRNSTGQCKDIG